MKILNQILVVLVLLTNITVYGQSKIKVVENRSKVVQLRGVDIYAVNKMSDGGLLFLNKKIARYGVISGPGKLTYLSRLASNMKDKKEKQLPLQYQNKRINYVDVKKIGSKYLLFFTFLNVKLKKHIMFFVQIDPTDLAWHGKPYYLADLPYKGKKGYAQGYFSINLSENNKYIIVTGINPTAIKRAKGGFFSKNTASVDDDKIIRSFSFWLLDENLSVVNHRRDFTIESKKGASLYMKRFKCDKVGNVFIVAENVKRRVSSKTSVSLTGKKKKKPTASKIDNTSYNIFKLGVKEEDEIEYETNDDVLLVDLNIGFSPDGKHVDAVGILYDEVSGLEVATGVHSIRLLKEDMSEVSNESTLFDKDFLKKINSNQLKGAKKTLSKKKSKKSKNAAEEKIKFYENGVTNLSSVNEVVYNKAGDISVIMEKQWLEIVTVTTYNAQTKTTTTTTYYIWHYGDVVMISGIGNEQAEPIMDYIPKDDHSLIKYLTGINVETDQKDWFIFGKSELFKVDSETLKQTSYKITAKGGSGGGKMRRASTGYSNSLFTDTYNLGDKEFVGVQLKSRKKMIVVRLKAS